MLTLTLTPYCPRTNSAWQAGACVTELVGWKQTSLCPEARLYPTGSWSVSWDTQDEGRREGGRHWGREEDGEQPRGLSSPLTGTCCFVITRVICWRCLNCGKVKMGNGLKSVQWTVLIWSKALTLHLFKANFQTSLAVSRESLTSQWAPVVFLQS